MNNNENPLVDLFCQMIEHEAKRICNEYGLDEEEVRKLAEGKSFDEFSEAIDKLMAEKQEAAN